MCCCGKAVINGEEGYSWDGKTFSIRKPWYPELQEGDDLIRDLPGRCGGVDSHSFDLRLVNARFYGATLLVQSGLGTTRLNLHCRKLEIFKSLSDDDCYWLLMMIYHTQFDSASAAQEREAAKWSKAAASKRIKTRKGTNAVKVWIEPERVNTGAI